MSNIILRGQLGEKVLKWYAGKFVDASALKRKNILWLVNKFCQTGTVNNLPQHRPYTALILETLAME